MPQWLFLKYTLCSIQPSCCCQEDSSTGPPAPSHRIWRGGSLTTKSFGEGRESIFCSATDVIWLVQDTGEAQEYREGEAVSSLCQATLHISTVVGNCSFNNNCTLTIAALTLVHPSNLVHLHILSSMYKPLSEEPKSYPNHDKPLRQSTVRLEVKQKQKVRGRNPPTNQKNPINQTLLAKQHQCYQESPKTYFKKLSYTISTNYPTNSPLWWH